MESTMSDGPASLNSSDTYPNSHHVTLSPQNASWQSIFGALVAIAVNVCLQDCGEVCEFHRDFSPLLRSSPIFCVVDTTIILVQLCYYVATRGFVRGLQLITAGRKQHENRSNKKLPWHIVRLGVLFVGVLQAIKLYSIQGIPWAKAIGTCYLASYIANGVLNMSGKQPSSKFEADEKLLPHQEVVYPAGKTKLLNVGIFIAHLAPWVTIGRFSLPNEAIYYGTRLYGVLHIPSFFALIFVVSMILFGIALIVGLIEVAIISIPVCIMFYLVVIPIRGTNRSVVDYISIVFDITPQTATMATCTLLCISICGLRLWLCKKGFIDLQPLYDKAFPTVAIDIGVKCERYAFVLVLILLAMAVCYIPARILLFGPLSRKLRISHLSIASNWGYIAICLFTGNLVFALSYFAVLYSPENTYKPEWTDSLDRVFLLFWK